MTSLPVTSDERIRTRGPIATIFSRPEAGVLIGAIAVFILFTIVTSTFIQGSSLATTFYGASVIGIMAVPVALLMIGGEFDLSAGVGVISTALTASLFSWWFNFNMWVGVLAALVFSLAIGVLNGYLLRITKLPSFIVTLGVFFMLAGANLALTRLIGGSVSSPSTSDMEGFASAKAVFASSIPVFGVNISITVLWWILLTVAAWYVLARTKVGNWIFAVGGDDKAARAVGVPVDKTKIGLFMAVGFCGWVVGMNQLFSYDTVQSGGGVGNEFIYIIAAVVGGCLLTGGYGSAIGAALGALIFGMVQNGIVYAQWNPDWFKFFLGLLLLIATLVNVYVKKKAEAK